MSDERWRDAFGPESDDELRARVPDELADRVWPRLATELAARPVRRGPARWLVRALAAALVVLISVTGWLVHENRQLRGRTLDRGPVPAPTLVAASRTVTAGELAARLSRLPADTPVLDAADAEQLLRRGRPLLYALLRGPELDAVIADGLTAHEAVAVLRRLDAQTPIRLGGGFTPSARTRS